MNTAWLLAESCMDTALRLYGYCMSYCILPEYCKDTVTVLQNMHSTELLPNFCIDILQILRQYCLDNDV
jgi:hypothetical protein